MYEINSMLVLFFRVILNVFAIKMCVVVEKEMYIMEFFWLLDCVVEDLVYTESRIHPLENFM